MSETNPICAHFRRLLPAHRAGLAIEHNPHLALYQTVGEYLRNLDAMSASRDWKDAEARQRSVDSGELWELRWYPNTPVGFCVVAAPTLSGLMELAVEAEVPR